MDLEYIKGFELYSQMKVPESTYIIVRLDGKGFKRLIKALDFVRPFDEGFLELMVVTTFNLMVKSGLKIALGYTISDEISLLLPKRARPFRRRVEKLDSIIAGHASAYFTQELAKLGYDGVGVFDARILVSPTLEGVLAYFKWRQEDAHRNALYTLCQHVLLEDGLTLEEVSAELKGKKESDQNELLFRHGINYNDVDAWKKRGVMVYRKPQDRGREIYINKDLPLFKKDEDFLRGIIVKGK